MKIITSGLITKFKIYLINEEKSKHTIEKYIKDISVFAQWLSECEITKLKVLEYKEKIINEYAPKSVNAMLSSINAFFNFMGWHELKVKTLKIQKQIFAQKDKELTRTEYERLLTAAKDKVFPHNLRHLFARTYYSLQKDIVRLADILGHSSVDTTRIYTMETGEEHRKQIEKMHLLRC